MSDCGLVAAPSLATHRHEEGCDAALGRGLENLFQVSGDPVCAGKLLIKGRGLHPFRSKPRLENCPCTPVQFLIAQTLRAVLDGILHQMRVAVCFAIDRGIVFHAGQHQGNALALQEVADAAIDLPEVPQELILGVFSLGLSMAVKQGPAGITSFRGARCGTGAVAPGRRTSVPLPGSAARRRDPARQHCHACPPAA